ncbi:MAG: winged helix-turn-helix domain-containing protein [Candidatus Acidiferrales bacterium]
MKATTVRTASFGPYALDLRSGELRKFGVRVKMGEQPFQILVMLLANPGELVSREELRAKLWADDTFVDFDHGLNSAVQRLRDCLSDTAEKPAWVETIPRRGYRFIGQVDWTNGGALLSHGNGHRASAIEEAPAREAMPAHRSRTATIWISAIAAVVLVAGSLAWVSARRKTPGPTDPASIRSIAVLPLENLSGDLSQDYFADGITDELITTLAKSHALRIASRGSIMRYKSVQKPEKEIARELGVDAVIVGSVARSGNHLRINAQLIRASDGSHLWSESYDRDLGDTLTVQEQLANAIAEQVRVASVFKESPHANAAARFNPEAHDAYLRGRYSWFKGDFFKSRDYFQKAIDLDPAYAPGYSGLADSYGAACVWGELPPNESMPRSEAAARKALQNDDSLAEAHNSLAAVKLFFDWDWNGAETEVRRAIELDPGVAEVHHIYHTLMSVTNRPAKALQEEQIAQKLDPFSRPWGLGWELVGQGRIDDGIAELRARLSDAGNNSSVHEILAEAYYRKGMFADAIAENKAAFILQGDTADATGIENAYNSGGYRGSLEWRLGLLKRKAKNGYVSPWQFAQVYAVLGRRDDAIHSLQQAFDQRDPMLVFSKLDASLDSLHSDPRYLKIVQAIGLP